MFIKVKEQKSSSNTWEVLRMVKRECGKVKYYGRIINFVPDVWETSHAT